ncbi:hypothetical protein B484DRAFT_451009, partial [Ochromonadaceae sp. CCMP2298]
MVYCYILLMVMVNGVATMVLLLVYCFPVYFFVFLSYFTLLPFLSFTPSMAHLLVHVRVTFVLSPI